jgi:hypothetical protein
MNILMRFLNLAQKENLFSKFKRNLGSIWEVVEVASVAAMEVASVEAEAEAKDSNNQKRRVKIITKFLVSKETPPAKKFIKSSKKWRLNTTQIKIKTIQKKLRKISKKSQMPMKPSATKKNEKFMMFMEKRAFNKMNNKKDHIIKVDSTISISINSLVGVVGSMAVVAVGEEAVILEEMIMEIRLVATRNKFMKTYLKIQMWRN